MASELYFLYEWCLKSGQHDKLLGYLQYWGYEYLCGGCKFPPLPLAYFQLNQDGSNFNLDPLEFDSYTTNDPSGRVTWYTCAEHGPAKGRWNLAVVI